MSDVFYRGEKIQMQLGKWDKVYFSWKGMETATRDLNEVKRSIDKAKAEGFGDVEKAAHIRSRAFKA